MVLGDYMKRYLSFILIFVFVFGMFVSVPLDVAADPLEPAMQTANMLEGGVFDFYADNEFVGSYASSSIEYNFAQAEWRWSHDTSLSYDKIVVVIQGSMPSSIYFKQSSQFPLTYEGSFGDDYHMYATYGYDYDTDSTCSVIGTYSSNAFRSFNLVSCIGYLSDNEQITSFDEGRTSFGSDGVYYPIKWNYNVSFPRFFSNEDYDFDEGIYYVNIQPDDRDIEFGKSISFLVRCNASSVEFTSALLKNSTVVASLNVSSVQSVGTTFMNTDRSVYKWYVVTVDLTGYDLVGNTIQLQTRIFDDEYWWMFSVYDCYISANIDTTPNFWGKLFMSITDLGDRIVDGLANVTFDFTSLTEAIAAEGHDIIMSLSRAIENAVTDLSSDIGGFFVTLRTTLSTILRNIESAVNDVSSTIGNYFNRLFERLDVAEDSQDAIESGASDMMDQAENMSEAIEVMDSIERPDIDTNNLFGDMLTFDPVGTNVLAAVTGNPKVSGMFLIVFTFALCGYVFFGKKD